MIRKLVVVAVLLAVGVVIALQLQGGKQQADTQPFEPQTGASAEVRIADLERALAAQIDRARALDTRVAELESRLGERGTGDGGQQAWRGGPPDEERIAEMRATIGENGRPDPAAMRERVRERQQQRLVEAGFTPERAAWIERRTEELELQAMQARYDAQRNGRPGQGNINVQGALRSEMGDAEYERYLTATNRPTEVQIMNVLASSPAEKSGVQAGDQIVSYAGKRVFDMSELEALVREGNPGESVTMEVRRNGQTVQVQVPRGVLGVEGGGVRGGPPGGRGPGGFRP